MLKSYGRVNESTIKERPTTPFVGSLTILSGYLDGACRKGSEVDPRQRGAITAQFLGYDAAARLAYRPKALVGEFSEKGGFTTAGAAGDDHVKGCSIHFPRPLSESTNGRWNVSVWS